MLDTLPYCRPDRHLIRYRIEKRKQERTMEMGPTCRGTVYPWQSVSCPRRATPRAAKSVRPFEITGIHIDRQARKPAPVVPAICNIAMEHLCPPEPALA
jgi:hypothetical protein